MPALGPRRSRCSQLSLSGMRSCQCKRTCQELWGAVALGAWMGKNGSAQSRETGWSGGHRNSVSQASCARLAVDLAVGTAAPGPAPGAASPSATAASSSSRAHSVPGEVLTLCVRRAPRIRNHHPDVKAVFSLYGWGGRLQGGREWAVCGPSFPVQPGGGVPLSQAAHVLVSCPLCLAWVWVITNFYSQMRSSPALRFSGSGARRPGVQRRLRLCSGYFILSVLSL